MIIIIAGIIISIFIIVVSIGFIITQKYSSVDAHLFLTFLLNCKEQQLIKTPVKVCVDTHKMCLNADDVLPSLQDVSLRETTNFINTCSEISNYSVN